MSNPKLGEIRTFMNLSAYPNLHRSLVKVISKPDSEYSYYGVIFLASGLRMAVTKFEII